MDFDFSPKVQDLRQRLLAFMDEHIYPNEALYLQQIEEGDRWEPAALLADLKKQAKKAGLWNLFLPKEYGRVQCRPDNAGIRTAGRDHGPRVVGIGSVQLQCARYRQHGSAGSIRKRSAAKSNGCCRCCTARFVQPSR